MDRVVAPGQTNNYPTLSDVGLPSILAENGLTRIPSINVDSGFLSIYTQCCVDTHFAHTLTSYSSVLQWVKGRHSIKVGGEQRVFLNNFWQPNYPTGSFYFLRDVTTQQPGQGLGQSDTPQGNPFATMLTGFPSNDGSQYNIVPAVADKSKETAFYVQDDWKVTSKLTVNVGLRYEWSTPYNERFNRLQFSNFTANTGINIPIAPVQGFPVIGNILGTTVFPTSSKRNAGVDRNNFAPRLGFAYQLARNTVVRGGAGDELPIRGSGIPEVGEHLLHKGQLSNPVCEAGEPVPSRAFRAAGDEVRIDGTMGILECERSGYRRSAQC